MRGISREVLARDAAWSLADGACKDLTIEWGQWENTYAAALTRATRLAALTEPAAICSACPITAECADLADLSGYTGIAAGDGYRNADPTTPVPGHRANGGRHERLAAVPQPCLARRRRPHCRSAGDGSP